jgi:hypothetical protein
MKGIEVTAKATIGGSLTSDDSTVDRSAEDADLMPEVSALLHGGDLGAEIAALAILSCNEQRKIAKQLRAIEEKTLSASEKAELDAMRDKAEHTRNAGFIGGFTTVGAGVLTMGAGACAGGRAAGSQAPAAGSEAPTADAGATAAKAANHSAKSSVDLSKVMEGSASVVQGGGKVWSTHAQNAADEANEEATAQQQMVSRQKRALEDTREMDSDAKKHMEKILDLYKQYSSAKQEASRAALFRA